MNNRQTGWIQVAAAVVLEQKKKEQQKKLQSPFCSPTLILSSFSAG